MVDGCDAPSTRVEGCAVMWCSVCHVFWDWDSARVIRTLHGAEPHNPDHRAWVGAGNGGPARELHDRPCGGFPDTLHVHRRIMETRGASTARVTPAFHEAVATIVLALDALLHAQYALRPRYAAGAPPPGGGDDPAPLRMRVAYILGDFMSDAHYASRVASHDRALAHRREIARVLESFVLCGLDVMQRFVGDDDEGVEATARACSRCALTADALADCARVWGRRTPELTTTLGWRVSQAHGRRRR